MTRKKVFNLSMRRTSYFILAGALLSSSVMTSTSAHASEVQNAHHSATKTNTQPIKDKGRVAKSQTKDNTSQPLDFNQARHMSPQELKSQLTSKDRKILDKDINDNHSEQHVHDRINTTSNRMAVPYSGTTSNINNYIKQHHLKPAPIKEDARIDNLPKYNYKSGQYIGVVIHDTGNDQSTLDGEVNFMYNHWQNAFVHAYVDGHQIRQTAPADYLAWGCGSVGNPFFYQIEMVHAHSLDEFAKAVNNDAYLTAYILKRHNLKPQLANTHGGKGTIISHNGVSKYYGGTDHTDPVGYFQRYGYNMTQYTELVKHYYNQLSGINHQSDKKTSKDYHKVTQKDTLYKISKRYGVSVDNLKDWNHLKDNTIYVGQHIYVVPSHQVQKGETLYRIAKSHNMSVKQLKSINHLKSNTIHIGQTLKLK